MQNPLSTHIARVSPRGRVSVWLRRFVLLGAVVLSLAMVGNPAAARGQRPLPSDAPSAVTDDDASRGLALALNGIGALHRSVASWSDGTAESAFLLVLGVGLISTGRWLSRAWRQDGTRALPSSTTTSHEAAILRPKDTRVMPFARRAAR